MTHPHRWLRAAHKIAPNGALFPDISCYRSGSTERSRPFPTNLPKVRNHPVRFIDKLTAPLPLGSGAVFFILLYTSKFHAAVIQRDISAVLPVCAAAQGGDQSENTARHNQNCQNPAKMFHIAALPVCACYFFYLYYTTRSTQLQVSYVLCNICAKLCINCAFRLFRTFFTKSP